MNGKPVRQKSNRQRPSSIEPEIFDDFTHIQKKEHIALVKEQKKSLDAAILKVQDRVLTLRGHIASSMFKGIVSSDTKPYGVKY